MLIRLVITNTFNCHNTSIYEWSLSCWIHSTFNIQRVVSSKNSLYWTGWYWIGSICIKQKCVSYFTFLISQIQSLLHLIHILSVKCLVLKRYLSRVDCKTSFSRAYPFIKASRAYPIFKASRSYPFVKAQQQNISNPN